MMYLIHFLVCFIGVIFVPFWVGRMYRFANDWWIWGVKVRNDDGFILSWWIGIMVLVVITTLCVISAVFAEGMSQ